MVIEISFVRDENSRMWVIRFGFTVLLPILEVCGSPYCDKDVIARMGVSHTT